MRHWTSVPKHVDMSCYAEWYQEKLRSIPGKAPVVVELGTRFGCSARILLDALPEDGKLFLYDTLIKEDAKELTEDMRVALVLADAMTVADHFADGSVSLLHVDLDPHTAEQTWKVFKLWREKIKLGGIIIFHDCTPEFGVYRFVKEKAEGYKKWAVEYCAPHTDSPISAPAALTRKKK